MTLEMSNDPTREMGIPYIRMLLVLLGGGIGFRANSDKRNRGCFSFRVCNEPKRRDSGQPEITRVRAGERFPDVSWNLRGQA